MLSSGSPPCKILLSSTSWFGVITFPPFRTIRQRNAFHSNTPAISNVWITLCRCKCTIWFTIWFKIILIMWVYKCKCIYTRFDVTAMASFDQGDVLVMATCPLEIATIWIGNAIRTAHRFLAVGMLAGFRGTRFLKRKEKNNCRL